jgi:hypothetical protein
VRHAQRLGACARARVQWWWRGRWWCPGARLGPGLPFLPEAGGPGTPRRRLHRRRTQRRGQAELPQPPHPQPPQRPPQPPQPPQPAHPPASRPPPCSAATGSRRTAAGSAAAARRAARPAPRGRAAGRPAARRTPAEESAGGGPLGGGGVGGVAGGQAGGRDRRAGGGVGPRWAEELALRGLAWRAAQASREPRCGSVQVRVRRPTATLSSTRPCSAWNISCGDTCGVRGGGCGQWVWAVRVGKPPHFAWCSAAPASAGPPAGGARCGGTAAAQPARQPAAAP